MQIWKWLIVLGLIFLITYNPSTRTLSNYFEPPRVDGVIPGTEAARETQSYRRPSDDDK